MLTFEKVEPAGGRCAAVVGDTVRDAIGAPTAESGPLVFNVTTQPSGSTIFSGLGTAGSNVSFAEISSAPFVQTGFYAFSVTASNVSAARIEVICFPAAALSVDRIKYASLADKTANVARSQSEIRASLRSLSTQCTQAGAQAALEGGAAITPFFGTRPTTLKASTSDNFTAFGGW